METIDDPVHVASVPRTPPKESRNVSVQQETRSKTPPLLPPRSPPSKEQDEMTEETQDRDRFPTAHPTKASSKITATVQELKRLKQEYERLGRALHGTSVALNNDIGVISEVGSSTRIDEVESLITMEEEAMTPETKHVQCKHSKKTRAKGKAVADILRRKRELGMRKQQSAQESSRINPTAAIERQTPLENHNAETKQIPTNYDSGWVQPITRNESSEVGSYDTSHESDRTPTDQDLVSIDGSCVIIQDCETPSPHTQEILAQRILIQRQASSPTSDMEGFPVYGHESKPPVNRTEKPKDEKKTPPSAIDEGNCGTTQNTKSQQKLTPPVGSELWKQDDFKNESVQETAGTPSTNCINVQFAEDKGSERKGSEGKDSESGEPGSSTAQANSKFPWRKHNSTVPHRLTLSTTKRRVLSSRGRTHRLDSKLSPTTKSPIYQDETKHHPRTEDPLSIAESSGDLQLAPPDDTTVCSDAHESRFVSLKYRSEKSSIDEALSPTNIDYAPDVTEEEPKLLSYLRQMEPMADQRDPIDLQKNTPIEKADDCGKQNKPAATARQEYGMLKQTWKAAFRASMRGTDNEPSEMPSYMKSEYDVRQPSYDAKSRMIAMLHRAHSVSSSDDDHSGSVSLTDPSLGPVLTPPYEENEETIEFEEPGKVSMRDARARAQERMMAFQIKAEKHTTKESDFTETKKEEQKTISAKRIQDNGNSEREKDEGVNIVFEKSLQRRKPRIRNKMTLSVAQMKMAEKLSNLREASVQNSPDDNEHDSKERRTHARRLMAVRAQRTNGLFYPNIEVNRSVSKVVPSNASKDPWPVSIRNVSKDPPSLPIRNLHRVLDEEPRPDPPGEESIPNCKMDGSQTTSGVAPESPLGKMTSADQETEQMGMASLASQINGDTSGTPQETNTDTNQGTRQMPRASSATKMDGKAKGKDMSSRTTASDNQDTEEKSRADPSTKLDENQELQPSMSDVAVSGAAERSEAGTHDNSENSSSRLSRKAIFMAKMHEAKSSGGLHRMSKMVMARAAQSTKVVQPTTLSFREKEPPSKEDEACSSSNIKDMKHRKKMYTLKRFKEISMRKAAQKPVRL